MQRKLVYDAARVHQLFRAMRRELDEMGERHRHEVESLRRELAEVRSAFDTLRSVSLARSKAEAELHELYRLREIGRARAAERDPAQPLH